MFFKTLLIVILALMSCGCTSIMVFGGTPFKIILQNDVEKQK